MLRLSGDDLPGISAAFQVGKNENAMFHSAYYRRGLALIYYVVDDPETMMQRLVSIFFYVIFFLKRKPRTFGSYNPLTKKKHYQHTRQTL